MCGILGSWGHQFSRQSFGAALDSIAHRGPDADAIWELNVTGRQVLLGHRRLSIIDLSEAANQPFQKDGLTIIYNGEIFNYVEVRNELFAAGTRFRTNSDTEVILEAFRRWGVNAFRKLRGMFALGILNEVTGELLLARDPFGIKPLFVAESDGGLCFASEPKALRALNFGRQIDERAILASLMFLWVPEDMCAFRGIEKLPAGGWLSIGPKGTSRGRYWNQLQEVEEARRHSISIEDLRLVLEDSVEKHMVADVPVSTFLSGGLDSSLVTVLAKRHSNDLDSYTIVLRKADKSAEAMPEDLPYARKVAALAGVRLHEIEVAPSVEQFLPRLVRMMDEPVGDPAALNVLLICELARASAAKVLLSGMGADEIFGGYRRHQAQAIAQSYRHIPGVFRAGINAISKPLPVSAFGRGFVSVRWLKRFLAFADLPDADAYLRSYTYWSRDELRELVPAFDESAFEAICGSHHDKFDQLKEAQVVSRCCFTDLHYFLPGLNLTYTDRASMAASTEVRVPFVDPKVVSAAFSLPDGDKATPFATKRALKRAAEAYLPREIIYRPKASFGVPLRAWMKNELAGAMEDLGNGSRLESRGFLDRKTVKSVISDFRRGKVDFSYQLWHLLVLESWLESVSDESRFAQRNAQPTTAPNPATPAVRRPSLQAS